MMRRLACLLFPLLLAACDTDSPEAVAVTPAPATAGTTGSTAGPATTPEPPAMPPLCVSSRCGRVIDIAGIPDAENTLVTPEGRVFVSGGTGVFEIRRSADGSYTAEPVHDSACNFTGLARRADVLYANCFDGRLYAARLTATPRLQPMHDYGLAAPNGLATGPDGALYLTNGPFAPTLALPAPKIVRVVLDPADPFRVLRQEDWLASGLTAPNGIAIRGDDIYITDSSLLPPALGRIERIRIGNDGLPGERQLIATLPALPDDLSIVGDGLLVTLFSLGSVALVGFDGSVLQQTDPLGLAFPSSVRLAGSPLFAAGDLLITQKGLIGDTFTPYGNRLSVLRPNNEEQQ